MTACVPACVPAARLTELTRYSQEPVVTQAARLRRTPAAVSAQCSRETISALQVGSLRGLARTVSGPASMPPQHEAAGSIWAGSKAGAAAGASAGRIGRRPGPRRGWPSSGVRRLPIKSKGPSSKIIFAVCHRRFRSLPGCTSVRTNRSSGSPNVLLHHHRQLPLSLELILKHQSIPVVNKSHVEKTSSRLSG